MVEKSLNALKNLNAKLNSPVKANSILFKNLNKAIEKATAFKLKLNYVEESQIYRLNYITPIAKEIMENFINIDTRNTFEDYKAGIKLSKMTHHAFCNVPTIAGPINNDSHFRTDKVLFYPASTLETEIEYTFFNLEEKGTFIVIDLVRFYFDTALRKPLLYKRETIKIKKDIVSIPENIEDIDLKTIKTQCIAISKEESLNKIKLSNRTAIYKEHSPVEDFSLLSECKIKDNRLEILTEEGEIITFQNLYNKRPVAFHIFGVGFEKNVGWFPAVISINVFKRKDLLSEKVSPQEYLEKHTYHTNGKKLKVNYRSLYLKGIKGIDKYPALWSFGTIITNKGKLNLALLIPIQRKVPDKENNNFSWKRTSPQTISKAVNQILGTEKINYKGEEIYLFGKRKFIEKEFIQIKDPDFIENELNFIKNVIDKYKTIQRIKNGIDFVEENFFEELQNLSTKVL